MRVVEPVIAVDSHTGGEPTRVIIQGGPDLGDGPIHQRLSRLSTEFEAFRSGVMNEPRGWDAMVGALLLPPFDPSCDAATVFFNNAGPLGMCGHGTIGLIATMAYLGRIGEGALRIETPVGVVRAVHHGGGRVAVENVESYRLIEKVVLQVPALGEISGDVAWGGNWFFLCADHGLEISLANCEHLTSACWSICRELRSAGISGTAGAEVDHIELFGPPSSPEAHSRNFVLCPGGAYDRSPCGTGTSAKLACLAADGKLDPGEVWIQESITGSTFEASYVSSPNGIFPTITGSAFVTAELKLHFDPRDPLCWGIPFHE